MQDHHTAFDVYSARTGEHHKIIASDWRDALRQANRPDACVIDWVDPLALNVTFDADCPQMVTIRLLRDNLGINLLNEAFINVLQHLDKEPEGSKRTAPTKG